MTAYSVYIEKLNYTSINYKNIIIGFFCWKTNIVQIVMIIMGAQKGVVAFHFISNWCSDFMSISFDLVFRV